MLDEDTLPRGPLPNGFDPWHPVAYDKARSLARNYYDTLARTPVTLVCQRCGAKVVRHPMVAKKLKVCRRCRPHEQTELKRRQAAAR